MVTGGHGHGAGGGRRGTYGSRLRPGLQVGFTVTATAGADSLSLTGSDSDPLAGSLTMPGTGSGQRRRSRRAPGQLVPAAMAAPGLARAQSPWQAGRASPRQRLGRRAGAARAPLLLQ